MKKGNLRIRGFGDLEHVSSSVRDQLKRELAKVPASALSRGRPEEAAGRLLIEWADTNCIIDVGAGVICSIGAFLAHNANGGWRTSTEAAIFVGQGVRPGWPDYTLYIPRGPWHGAVIELKALDGDKPTAHQLDILVRLERMGYKPMVAWGFEHARDQILEYLRLS